MSNKNFKLDSFAVPSAFDPKREDLTESSHNNVLSTIYLSGGTSEPTARSIDLNRGIAVLKSASTGTAYYELNDGVEGQVIYLSSDPSNTNTNIDVYVTHARSTSAPFGGSGLLLPFSNPTNGVSQLVFTGGSWQLVYGGQWD